MQALSQGIGIGIGWPRVGAGGGEPAPPWWDEWWLGHGIAAESFLGVYQGVGAPTYEDSLINLVNPGTNNLVAGINSGVVSAGGQAPRAATFDPAIGWKFALDGESTWDRFGFFNTGIISVVGYGGMIHLQNQYTGNGYAFGCANIPADQRSRIQLNGVTSIIFNPSGAYTRSGTSVGTYTVAFFGQKCYYNGLLVGTAAAGNAAIGEIYFNGSKDLSNGSNHSGVVGSIKSCIFTEAITPSDAEVLALHNAMMSL